MNKVHQPQNEDALLNDILNNHPRWKGLKLWWCDLCETASIGCNNPECHGSSCNAMGCESCIAIHKEFNKEYKTTLHEYLSHEENQTVRKAHQIQKFILESLAIGEKEINWKRMYETGHLSQQDMEIFQTELKDHASWKEYGS